MNEMIERLSDAIAHINQIREVCADGPVSIELLNLRERLEIIRADVDTAFDAAIALNRCTNDARNDT